MWFPGGVRQVFSILHENGYAAYAVGGSVRDFLLGKTPKDYDVATDARPDEVLKLFGAFSVIPTGIKHGTVTVLINQSPVEITTFRTDGVYLDNRRPSSVTFSKNIGDDLKRRDFTVNAIAYSPADGYVDRFGGMEDLKNRLIRCVGDADERFGEDALRILRAFRLAAELEFAIEEETARSIHRNRALLRNISAERINAEFTRLLLSQKAAETLLSYRDVIDIFLPGIKEDPCLEEKAKILSSADDLCSRLAVLLDGLAGWRQAEDVLRNLKYDNQTIRETAGLMRYKNLKVRTGRQHIRLWLKTAGESGFIRLLALKGLTEDMDAQKRTVREILDQKECYSLKNLAVSGEDLLRGGMREGAEIGKVLNRLLMEVILERLPNEKTALMEYAKRWIQGSKI